MIPPENTPSTTGGQNHKANMDSAKGLMQSALKKFKRSFYMVGPNGSNEYAVRKPSSATTADKNTKILYVYNAEQFSNLYSYFGVAYGFKDDRFDCHGYFTKTVTGGGAYINMTINGNLNGAKGTSTGGAIRFGKVTDQFYVDYKAYLKAKKLYLHYKDIYEKKNPDNDKKQDDGAGGGGTTPPAAAPTTYAYGDTKLKYNLGAVNEMYFVPSSTPGGVRMSGGNQPVRRVGNAQELWTDKHYVSSTTGTGKKAKTTTELVDNETKSAYKGMVQSYSRAAAKTTTGGSSEATPNKSINPYRMGFQFHYNPSRISTTWAGNVNVDVGYVASGKDKFGPIGAALATGSGLTITIPINRLADMKYVNTSESEWGTMPWQELYGVPIKEAPSGKESQSPTFEDLRKIRDLGTMYDVEFLLQTIVGYRMKSAIRLNRHAMTSDLGYLGGLPVELHLGKNIRYYVSVTNISVNHSIFTKDMIPTLTELTFTCSRLPDYLTK